MKDGGAAFPHDALHQNAGGFAFPESGMSLRDYFAAAALQALILKNMDSLKYPSAIAEDAFVYSDAMLAECEKEVPR